MKLNKIKQVLDENWTSQIWLSKKLDKSFSMVNAYCCNIYAIMTEDTSKDFDKVYQKVKSALFSRDVKDRDEKDILNAVSKIKVLQKDKLLSTDYLFYLISVVKADALSGFEIRFINQLALKDATKLPQKITANIGLVSSSLKIKSTIAKRP